ncbi:MFS general substrate transporter [Favolaschia claudopus]|uniref:MFS general substrate transporter n=1 Tax=Favolaschia claudopus TaxID=2862362 RepID=A0AAW0D5F9_9AGAR
MDTPHVIQTRSKHLSWLLETHPVIQAPPAPSGDLRTSWAWLDPPLSIAELEEELAVEEERFRRYGGDDPRDPPPKTDRQSRRFSSATNATGQPRPANRRFSTATRATSALMDPEEVNWDGPEDPSNPQNWTVRRKWIITVIVCIMTVNVTFATSAPSAATPIVAKAFGVSVEAADLMTSMFLLGYVLGPLVWGPGSELYGRRPIFVLSLTIYTLFHLAQALAQNLQTMLIARFIGGFFAVSPLVNAGGLIADIWDTAGRGPAMSVFTAAVFLGPVIGPIVGGFILQNGLTWRWIFWVGMMFAAVCTGIMILTLPETYAPVILLKKAKALRKADPVGNRHLFAAHEKQDWSLKGVTQRTLFRPFQMIASELILILITVYLSLVYGVLYALFQAVPIIFKIKRGFTVSQSGLVFVGVGVGTTFGALLNIWLGRNYPPLIKKWRGFPPPEQRLPGAMVGGVLFVIGIFWMGWSGSYPSVPWYVPALSLVMVGMSVSMIFISCLSYLVETYLMYSASAFAANTFFRSLVAAAFPLFTIQFFTNLGVNWAATLLGGVGLLLLPSPFLFYKYGARIRANSRFAPCLDLKIAEALAQEQEMQQTTKIRSLADDPGSGGDKTPPV